MYGFVTTELTKLIFLDLWTLFIQKCLNRNHFEDFLAEDNLYRKTEDLVKFLMGWQSTNANLFGRARLLMSAMVQRKFIAREGDTCFPLLSICYPA